MLTLSPRACSPKVLHFHSVACSSAQPADSTTNAAFVEQMCGVAASEAYDHLLHIARAAGSCSLSLLVARVCDGFVVMSRDGGAQE